MSSVAYDSTGVSRGDNNDDGIRNVRTTRALCVNQQRRQKIAPPDKKRLKGENKCFIFSNCFKGTDYALPQNEIDEANITKAFEWLNFDVHDYPNLGEHELKSAIRTVLSEDYSEDDCVVRFFLSHGWKDKILFTNDGRNISINDFVQNFINCKQLNGKAKLFFVSASRGNNLMETVDVSEDDKVSTADSKKIKKAKDADVFIYFPTTEGNKVGSDDSKGSYFVDTLCRVLHDYGGEYSLNDSVAKVNELLSKCVQGNNKRGDIVSVGEVQHTLTYEIFFNPKT